MSFKRSQAAGRTDCDGAYIGRNLRMYRRRAGLTIRELALRVGIQPGPLGDIERGLHAPSARVLAASARELKVTADALLSLSAGDSRSRADTGLPKPFLIEKPDEIPLSLRAEHMASELIDAILALEDLSGAPKQARIPLCAPIELTAEGMERHARAVRDFFGIGDGIVFDYFELFESAGLRVIVARIPPGSGRIPDSFTWCDPGNHNAFVFLDDRLGVERTLFQLACGLARVYHATAALHGLELAPLSEPLDAVHAARRFAAVFLMPEMAVRRTVRQLGLNDGAWTWAMLLRIKHRFGVSAESFLYRLEELSLIADKANQALRAQLKAHYAEHGHTEPDATRRILTPNGRIWDLAMMAAHARDPQEHARARKILERWKVVKG